MARLRLESTTDSFDLDGIMDSGTGVVALEGVSGVGLPTVSTQWVEGAGNGATYRGERVLPRDIDLPLLIATPDRAAMRDTMTRLARMLAGPMTFRFIDHDDTSWTLDVRRAGGGQMVLGSDTDRDLRLASTVVTLRAGDPFWTSGTAQRATVAGIRGRGLIKDPDGTGSAKATLSALRVSSSQTLGEFTMRNEGDAEARPVWTVNGPGEGLVVTSSTGESFAWNGTLSASDTLVIDTARATVILNGTTSVYRQLGPAPRLWKVPPGTTTARVEFTNTDSATSRIVAEWRPRRWTVI
jgi:phage-related protein